ncbi:MAG: hypothetical protein HQL10_08205 [Nitrospirae bacterium]|nr:hypothetical protein [Nitrospirota bacterium]
MNERLDLKKLLAEIKEDEEAERAKTKKLTQDDIKKLVQARQKAKVKKDA